MKAYNYNLVRFIRPALPRLSLPQPYKTCNDNHFCMTLSTADLEALPVITVHLDGGVEVLVRPEAYMDALGKDNAYAPRFVTAV